MIDLQDALAIIKNHPGKTAGENLTLSEISGRVLTKAVKAPSDSPPVDKSAMDGYALPDGDILTKYRILGTVAAGDSAAVDLTSGNCLKIMTGARMPPGAKRVIRVEYTRQEGEWMYPLKDDSHGNVIFKGENIRAGEDLLHPKILGPKDIGILAAFGIDRAEVAVPPRVGIITTGSEIVDPGRPLPDGMIFNSNGPQLAAQVSQTGAEVFNYGIVPDDREELARTVREALNTQDIVILSGGVSMGDFDLVPGVLAEAGVKIEFHSVAVKPGKPTLFGKKGDTAVFGLPGNPVSVYIIFDIFVKPYIYSCMGLAWVPGSAKLPLGREVSRRDAKRTEFLPIIIREGRIYPIRYGGSSHLSALAEAEGFMEIPRHMEKINEGESVDVRFL